MEHVAFEGEVFCTTPTTLAILQEVIKEASSTSNSKSCASFVEARRSGFTLLTEGIVTYSKAATKLSEDQSAPLFAETASATLPSPFNAPAASDGGATHEAWVSLEEDAGMEGASPKRQRIVSEKNFPVL